MSAVIVIDRQYVTAHGRAPRGQGYWGFCTVDPHRGDYLDHIIWVGGTYARARNKAVAQAENRGIDTLWVCS